MIKAARLNLEENNNNLKLHYVVLGGNFKKKEVLQIIFFTFGRPHHLSSIKQCSGDLISL